VKDEKGTPSQETTKGRRRIWLLLWLVFVRSASGRARSNIVSGLIAAGSGGEADAGVLANALNWPLPVWEKRLCALSFISRLRYCLVRLGR
jgi:hypothetical protein